MTPSDPPAATADESLFEAHDVPALVCVIWPDADSARACTRGTIDLRLDPATGVLANVAFDPDRVAYTEGYENSLHFSEFFQGYIREFAQDLVQRHGLAGKRALEIGCGDGQFLDLLVELGMASAHGFDPSWPAERPTERADGRVQVVRAYYGPDADAPEVDLVVCRQVLEHVPDPLGFLRLVRRALGARTDVRVVFEVPNAAHTLRTCALWEVVYEHRTYFTAGSLARLMAEAGFDVTGSVETFGRTFVAVEGRPSRSERGALPAGLDSPEDVARMAADFRRASGEKLAQWRADLADMRSAGKRVALWGAGARGVSLLNLADPDGAIGMAVDINPRKHGHHLAGTGQAVHPPQDLPAFRPDVVVVLNAAYVDEITQSLHDMGLRPEVRLA